MAVVENELEPPLREVRAPCCLRRVEMGEGEPAGAAPAERLDGTEHRPPMPPGNSLFC